MGFDEEWRVQKKEDTRDELLFNLLDVIAWEKERQDALNRQHAVSSQELQSSLMLTVEFSNIYYTPVPTLSLEK